MKNKILLLASTIFLFVSSNAFAGLTTIGAAHYDGETYNLIWDDDNNGNSVVWLDYTNEVLNWDGQMNWAAGLGSALTVNLNGYTSDIDWSSGWRLPSVGDNPQSGYGQTTSEMGHLYSEEDIQEFINLVDSRYWSGTELAGSSGNAWYFHMGNGQQGYVNKYMSSFHGLAVCSGDVSVVPLPGAFWLLGTGILGLIGWRRKNCCQ